VRHPLWDSRSRKSGRPKRQDKQARFTCLRRRYLPPSSPATLKGGNRCAGTGATSWPGPALIYTYEAENSLQCMTHPITIDSPRCQYPTTPGVRPSARASGAHNHRQSATKPRRDRYCGVDAPQPSAAEYNAVCVVLHFVRLYSVPSMNNYSGKEASLPSCGPGRPT